MLQKDFLLPSSGKKSVKFGTLVSKEIHGVTLQNKVALIYLIPSYVRLRSFRMNVCNGSSNKPANYRRDVVRNIGPWFFVETQREANYTALLDTQPADAGHAITL
jgi:hypothetical protein